MTRYWMSMNEALWMLLTTANERRGGQTFLLHTTDEIRVVDVARRVWRLITGFDDGCPIVFCSPRPGERLREVLVSANEELEPGPRPGLLRAVDVLDERHLDLVRDLVDQIAAMKSGSDPTSFRSAVMSAAEELQ